MKINIQNNYLFYIYLMTFYFFIYISLSNFLYNEQYVHELKELFLDVGVSNKIKYFYF